MDRRDWIQKSSLSFGGMLLAPAVAIKASVKNDPVLRFRPQWEHPGWPIRHSWAGIGNIDQARWLLRSDMQKQMEICRDEIGLKHLRFGNIFEEQLWIYDKDPSKYQIRELRNEKRINWRNPFAIYDALVERNICPIVGPYFMPWAFASGKETCYEIGTNITPPKDLHQWGEFVKKFVHSVVNRYGIEVVKNWYFEVWNEPNLKSFYSGIEDYWKLYRVVYESIKSVDSGLKVGGPSTAHAAYIPEMIEFGRKNNCLPDYIIGHIYNNDSGSGDPLSPFEGPQVDLENKSPNYVSGIARGVHKILHDYGYRGEYHMNEWGLSWYPFRPERETSNEAAFIVKTMKEVSQMCDYFAYWCLSDIYVECGYGREAFHGNYGLLSMDGLRKPSFWAHHLLCKLGNIQIPVENEEDQQVSAFVTKSMDSINVLFYSFDINFISESSSYSKKEIEFFCPDKIAEDYVSLIRVDSKENNILHVWNELGKPSYPNKKELEFLKSRNQLRESEKIKIIRDSSGNRIRFSMESPGIVFVEIKV